jgi:hypothetical protein
MIVEVGCMEASVMTHDVTKTNEALRRLLDKVENPRHRFLLLAYDRHRNLEMAGRYEEIFAPDMMSETPVYHLQANETNVKLEGREAIKSLYRMWSNTHQAIFYTEKEQVAVADNFVASVTVAYQQVSGRSLLTNRVLSYLPRFLSTTILKRALAAKTFKVDASSMYLYKSFVQMIWSYDDGGRLLGEDVWEPDPDQAEITKLDPADVLTTQEAARLLAPFIKPLPRFNER